LLSGTVTTKFMRQARRLNSREGSTADDSRSNSFGNACWMPQSTGGFTPPQSKGPGIKDFPADLTRRVLPWALH
jgi:hypothetical protein